MTDPMFDVGGAQSQPVREDHGSGNGGVTTRAPEVARHAAAGGGQVVGEAANQASAVVHQAKDQVHSLIGSVRSELGSEADTKGRQAAERLRSMTRQIEALEQGRPEEAEQLMRWIGTARERVVSMADKLEQGGPSAVARDTADFARRRPGAFLALAVAAGFAVGRAARAASASGTNGNGTAMTTPPATPRLGGAGEAPSSIGAATYGEPSYGSTVTEATPYTTAPGVR